MKLAIAAGAGLVLAAGAALAQDAAWRPEFTKTNTPAQMKGFLPAKALAEGVSGEVVLNCVASAKGELVDCKVADETPAGYGFGEAALKAVANERIKPKDEKGQSVAGRPVVTYLPFLAPGDSNPEWLRKPDPDDMALAFPVAAMKKGVNGRAVLECSVTVEGFLANCKVAFETPEGLGFGAAALQLSPQFRMTPKMRGGKAVASTIQVGVVWPDMKDMKGESTRYRVILDPPWSAVPTAEDVRQAWPAKSTEKAATASVRCRLNRKGELILCQITSESPEDKGFGRAALKLAEAKFKVRVNPDESKGVENYSVDIPFRFRNPAEPDSRKVTKPKWITALSAESVALVFPDAATQAGISKGRATIDCLVGVGGKMTDCKVISEEPTALGFGEAVVKAAGYMTMNPWSVDGDPLDGLRVTLPIVLMVTDPEPKPDAAP